MAVAPQERPGRKAPEAFGFSVIRPDLHPVETADLIPVNVRGSPLAEFAAAVSYFAMAALVAIATLLAAPPSATAQTTHFYGSAGNYQGSARSFGGATEFYGPSGQYQGTARSLGSGIQFFGPAGEYQGSTSQLGSTLEFYGSGGQFRGSSRSLDDTTQFYRSAGEYDGSARPFGTITQSYFAKGRYEGSAVRQR